MARLAFFGTPALAATQLRALLASSHRVVLVVAQPDRPSGRGQKLQPPPTKALALEHGIEVLQPETLKKGTPSGDAFFERFSNADIDLAVVAAYGRIVPQRILDVPKRGFVNVHASLLPRWRGAAPIQRAIQAGDEKTGVCLMRMVKDLDAGDVYACAEVAIAPDDTGETLTEKVADAGAALLARHLDALVLGTLPRAPQPTDGITYAAQLQKEEGRIDWNKRARDIIHHARAMIPWPGAFTTIDGQSVKLFRPHSVDVDVTGALPGEILGVGPFGLMFATGDARVVAFEEVQLPGRGRITAAELAGGSGRHLVPAHTRATKAVSAALRHLRDAERLLVAGEGRSIDQAFHLAGYAPECARNACLSHTHFEKALGHTPSRRIVDFVATLDRGLERNAVTAALGGWDVTCRYEPTGTRTAEETTKLVTAAARATLRTIALLWCDGRIADKRLLR